jgi:hypothetical protein
MKVKMSPEDGLPSDILSDGEESPTEEDPKNPLRYTKNIIIQKTCKGSVLRDEKRVGQEDALQRNFGLCNPRKGTARPQSQFPHSCALRMFVSYLYIPTISPPIFLQQNRQTDSGNFINRSQKHECRNWD